MDNGLINIICIAYPTSLQSFYLNRGSTQKKKFKKINHKIGTKNVAITDLALGTCESLQTDRFHIHCTTVLTI